MKIDPVDHTEQISESSLDCAATGQSEAATAEQSREPGFIIGFFNSSMRAQTHLARRDVSPQEAALLLYGLVPRRRADSDELDQPSENGLRPEVYSTLISKFVETAKDGKCRDLRDWLKIAQESGLKHSTWLKLYLEAAKQLSILVGPSDNGNAAEAVGPEIINSLPPAQCVSEASAISRATEFAASAPSLTDNVGSHVALAAEQQRITSNNSGQATSGDKDATGTVASLPDAQFSSGAPERGEPSMPPIAEQSTTTTHRVETRKNHLTTVIAAATKEAANPEDKFNVWAALSKMAESDDRPSPLLGFSSEGVQYAGDRYQKTGEPDVLSRKNLFGRLSRAKPR